MTKWIPRIACPIMVSASLSGCGAAEGEGQDIVAEGRSEAMDAVLQPPTTSGEAPAQTTRAAPTASGAPDGNPSPEDGPPGSGVDRMGDPGGTSGAPEAKGPAGMATDAAMPTTSQARRDAGMPQTSPPPRDHVTDLSDHVLATWGSSVCDGFAVPAGSGWAWSLERKLAEIRGPDVSHQSTGGHNTNSKESARERAKVASADFVVVCLSLGNQGLGSASSESRVQGVVDGYLDDIFTDDSERDGDPESLVSYIESLGAFPIVTLVYPMRDYNTTQCRGLVEANIVQQSYGIPTINHLGTTNAGNHFDEDDCQWANGRNAPIDAENDARHPNQLGQDENFYAFPPDLPFALASGIPFPVRPEGAEYHTILQGGHGAVTYTPQYDIHNYTLQFAFQVADDGTLCAVDLGTNGAVTVEVRDGRAHLFADDEGDALQSEGTVTDGSWHDLAVTYSHVRQVITLCVDGALVGEHDARRDGRVRELFPRRFVVGDPTESGRAPSPPSMRVRDLFINRASLHAREVEERATTAWVGAGSLDVYAPLLVGHPTENRAQTLQTIAVGD